MSDESNKRRRTEPLSRAHKFSDLPFDVLLKIAAPFGVRDLWAASLACRSWRDGLRPLREAMSLVHAGKRYSHNGGNSRHALESFLGGAARGSAAAMVDAGFMYWEMGRREEAVKWYEKAAEIGYPKAQCNLGACYLEADNYAPEKAVKWFNKAAESGYARAQYNLALCLRKGHGVKLSPRQAAKWYLRAAEGGYVRAMYNTSLCYSMGEGFKQDLDRARVWMKRAANSGHRKAQLECGLEAFHLGNMMKALIYLELAKRAGETAAIPYRDVAFQSLNRRTRNSAMNYADRWVPLTRRTGQSRAMSYADR